MTDTIDTQAYNAACDKALKLTPWERQRLAANLIIQYLDDSNEVFETIHKDNTGKSAEIYQVYQIAFKCLQHTSLGTASESEEDCESIRKVMLTIGATSFPIAYALQVGIDGSLESALKLYSNIHCKGWDSAEALDGLVEAFKQIAPF